MDIYGRVTFYRLNVEASNNDEMVIQLSVDDNKKYDVVVKIVADQQQVMLIFAYSERGKSRKYSFVHTRHQIERDKLRENLPEIICNEFVNHINKRGHRKNE